ncbi:MAG TPA: YqiA/YcfP family alpha/beta fold hydrolase, partial [Polyangia bacterium]|nr:YqiA/YcfP family alpha/beta fold hydrolase [Polyangia bacterium]
MSIPTDGPRWLYLHGFASGPQSAKAVALAKHYEDKGIALERLNLRVPSLERLSLSAGLTTVRAAIGDDARQRAVLIGSSLGGLQAALAAADDARVCALVLLAPAFDLVARWQRRLGAVDWQRWQTSGWLAVDDWTTGQKARLSFDFIRDAAAVEARLGAWPDVRVPTLIVHGVNDDTVGIDGSRKWAAGKRQVRLVEVDDNHELVESLP